MFQQKIWNAAHSIAIRWLDHFPKFPGRTKLKFADIFDYDLAVLRLTVIIELILNYFTWIRFFYATGFWNNKKLKLFQGDFETETDKKGWNDFILYDLGP